VTAIYADFNARTRDDRVRLNTVGSKQSLSETGAGPGAWVWLSDGEMRSGAVIEDSSEGVVAQVAWETAEEIVHGDVLAKDVDEALRECRAAMQGPQQDYKRLLRWLPLAERGMPPGKGDYYRSRAAQAFGYPRLALLAIEDALEKAPRLPAFLHQQLDLLKRIDLDLALEQVEALSERSPLPALVIAACASVYNAAARRLEQTDHSQAATFQRMLLKVTDRFETSPDYDTAPHSVTSMVYITRGFAFLHLRERESALKEFDRAVKANPDNAEALAARGLETYPEPDAVNDLLRAVQLGHSSFWPMYYLTHHFVRVRDWPRAEEFARTAQAMVTPARIRANLLEWLTIAEFQQDRDVLKARQGLRQALIFAPDSEHLKRNLKIVEDLAVLEDSVESEAGFEANSRSTVLSISWDVVKDFETQTLDLAA
jgi:tetratricopeptide (TPR) repeat protein